MRGERVGREGEGLGWCGRVCYAVANVGALLCVAYNESSWI